MNQVAGRAAEGNRNQYRRIGGGLRRDAFGDMVSILHVSADCAEGGII